MGIAGSGAGIAGADTPDGAGDGLLNHPKGDHPFLGAASTGAASTAGGAGRENQLKMPPECDFLTDCACKAYIFALASGADEDSGNLSITS